MSTDESIKVDEKVEEEGENLEIIVKDNAKVALDTDDAPFLEEEPEEEPEEPEALLGEPGSSDLLGEEKRGLAAWSKKKKIVVGVSGILLLLIAIVVCWFLFKDFSITDEKIIEPTIIVIPDIEVDQSPKDFYINLEPFLLELKNAQGKPVFLMFKFTAFTKDQALAREAENKFLLLRDAVYYYLINKTHTYLIDPVNVDVIKNDLSSVLSGYLAGGKVDGVLFESYLTK